jgi:GT2 family glycosyltransferase
LNSAVPTVTIIIPHSNGESMLRRCLLSLKKTVYHDYVVLIVDNASTDSSPDILLKEFPSVQIVRSEVNRGYAGGCNYGLKNTQSPYVVFLNNDAEVSPNWLTSLVEIMEKEPDIAAVQPKILSVEQPSWFDYSGAAGGEIDIFGYPFARGRLFHLQEKDTGQYDAVSDIFWATGAALMVRRSCMDRVGRFEEAFFAHMEEIDLCWRFHLAGFRVCVDPSAVVYHQTGGTLGQQRMMKMVLNHRNNLLMLLRNYSWPFLILIFPVRLLMETITWFSSLICGHWKRMAAVPLGFFSLLGYGKTVLEGRRLVKRIRVVPDRRIIGKMYNGSVAFSFFVLRKRVYRDLIK